MPRDALDRYFTPKWMTRELLARVPISGRVFEPCAGDGSIVAMLEKESLLRIPEVITNDYDPKTEWDYQRDAVMYDLFDEVNPDWVVTNPPYDNTILHDIVKNSLQAAYTGVAMLLRLSFLEPTMEKGKTEESWLIRNPPDLQIVTPRWSFTGNGKTDSVTTAWYVWYNTDAPPYEDFRVSGALIKPWPRGIQIIPRTAMEEPEAA